MGCVGSKGLVKSSNQVDDIWDVFTRIKLLGRGASGEVWLVKDKNGDMHALKKLDRSDPQNQAMFEHECGILQKLDHPNILKFVDCYETPDDYVIVTQFLQGGEFFDRLQAMQHYSEKAASKLAVSMIKALYHCHKKSIVHRDLKPENYVFETKADDSEMRLIDFGCAKEINDNEVYKDMAGTPYYISPEVLDPKFQRTGKVLKAADMWSMGVIIFIMVTGTPPFNGQDDRAIMKAVSKGEYHWPRNLKVSESLKDLVAKLLVMQPEKRLTALQALEHPWLKGANSNSDESLNDTLVALRDFSNAAKIKKAVANILVNQMTEDDVKKLANLFSTLDIDGDGTLDVAEIASYMKRLFSYDDHTAEQQAKQFLNEVDVDNSGKIDVKEFQAAHVRGQLGVDTAQIKKAFDAIDIDGDGFLDTNEIEKIMEGSSANLGSTVRDIITECDKNGDGRISFDEFIAAMKSDTVKKGAAAKK